MVRGGRDGVGGRRGKGLRWEGGGGKAIQTPKTQNGN